MEQIIKTLKLARQISYSENITFGEKELLRAEIDRAFIEVNKMIEQESHQGDVFDKIKIEGKPCGKIEGIFVPNQKGNNV